MATRFGRWSLVRIVAVRLTLRDRPAKPIVDRVLAIAALVLVAATAAILLGVSNLLLASAVFVSAFAVLGAATLRYFPTSMAVSVIGIAIACASLMTALSVTTGFEREITRSMARVNGHVLLTKYGLDFFEYEVIADKFASDERVEAASPFAFSMIAIVGGVPAPQRGASGGLKQVPTDGWPDDEWPADDVVEEPVDTRAPVVVIGKGILPERAEALVGFKEAMSSGTLDGIRPGDSRHPPGIVLGDALMRELNVEVGEHVRVVVPAEIDGNTGATDREPKHAVFEVLDTFHTGTSELDRNVAMMHITAAQAIFWGEGRATGIEFQLTDAALSEPVAADMDEALDDVYRLSTWQETNADLLVGLKQIRAVLSLVLGLMVIVAASSLVASLLLIVRRKRHDIAVLMSLGGDRALVFWTFEAMGIFAGLVGATLGVAIGGLFCAVIDAYRFPLGSDVYPVDHLPVLIRAIDAFGPAAAAIILCACASGPIASLATRVRVVQALKI